MRVYDSDFTTSPNELINLAAEIALSYDGNWDAMCDWKVHCRSAQPLDPKQARTILNMALSDVTQHRYHERIKRLITSSIVDGARALRPLAASERPESPRHVVVSLPVQRPVWIHTKCKFNSAVFRPNHISGKLHLTDHGRTKLKWEFPYLWDTHTRDESIRIPKLTLYGWCGKHYDNPLLPDIEPVDIVSQEKEMLRGYSVERFCVGCVRVERNPGYPPSGGFRSRS